MRATVRKAFTLVEILIVVVILGILAAIVVPQFTNATQEAQGGNIQSQLDTLNNQIELFRARHNAYPPFTTGGDTAWDMMVEGADVGDSLEADDGTPIVLTEAIEGGYLKSRPKNPYNGKTTVGNSATNDGWVWADLMASDGVTPIGKTLHATNFDEEEGEILEGDVE